MKKKAGEVSSTDSFPEETFLPMPDFAAKWQSGNQFTFWRPVRKVSATGGAWSRSWHFAWLPASGGPFSRGAFFFRMGRGPSGWLRRVEDPEPPELMDPEEVKKRILFLFFQLGGMEWRGRFCFFFCFGWLFVFFWDVPLKIYWNNWNIIGVQRLMVFWKKVILWRWEQFQPDLQGLCEWSGNGTQMDHFLRPASVLAIAPLERCGKLERWNDICNSIDAVGMPVCFH